LEVPLGSTEQEVESWLSRNIKYLPTKLVGTPIDAILGHSVELAGVAENDVSAVIQGDNLARRLGIR